MVTDVEREHHFIARPEELAEARARGAAILKQMQDCLAELDALGWTLAAGQLSHAAATLDRQLSAASIETRTTGPNRGLE